MPEKHTLSRGQQVAEITLPPIGDVAPTWAAFLEAGPSIWTAAGEQPLDWPQVEAFRRLSQVTAWEAAALVRMSVAYVAEKQAATKPMAMSPMAVTAAPDRGAVDKGLREAFAALR